MGAVVVAEEAVEILVSATTMGFEVVYGDTDSLFLNYVNSNNVVQAI